MLRILFAIFTLLFLSSPGLAAEFDHSAWNQLLGRNVIVVRDGQASQVDYAGFARDRTKLAVYLSATKAVSRAQFDTWSKSDQLAFLINVYNAQTVELVLTGYPKIKSIKDLGTLVQSPWKKPFFTLFGKPTSLDDLEHGLIRGSGRYNDPRIHFAVNCASIGCPALRAEAFTGQALDAQLEDQTRKFLSDRSRNRLSGTNLELSSIFKWCQKDFEAGWRGTQGLTGFLARYSNELGLSQSETNRLRAGELRLSYLAYDWRLNGKAR